MTHPDRPVIGNRIQRELLISFLRLTGYGPGEILSLSYETNTFLCRNGGKYKMRGDRIEHLAGPSPDPNERM